MNARARWAGAVAVLGIGLLGTPAAMADPQPAPTGVLTAAQTTGLAPAGDRIVVSGKGFRPSARLSVGTWASTASAPERAVADQANALTVTASTDGEFATELAVNSGFAAAADSFEIRASALTGPATVPAVLGITFAKASTPAPSTSAPVPTAPKSETPATSPKPTAPAAVPQQRTAPEPVAAAAAERKLTASKTQGLNPAGEKVSVSGQGYDESKGIYVAFCVDNGAGKAPSPCYGGADMSGTGGSSAWISSNPPDYGKQIAKPYGAGGSFSLELTIKAKDDNVDCLVQQCAIVTRNDHTRGGDRSQDVRIPVTFSTGGGGGTPPPAGENQPPANPPVDNGGSGGGTGGGGTGGGSGTGGGGGGTDGGGTGSGSGGGTGGGRLAQTGTDALVPLSLGGGALLVGGTGAILLSRRRRTSS